MPRGVFNEYERTSSRGFRYKYICENCSNETDWISSEISQKALTIKRLKRFRAGESMMRAPKELKKIDKQANIALTNSIGRINRAIAEYADVMLIEGEPLLVDEFNRMFFEGSACPKCGARQPWYPAVSEIPSPPRAARSYALGFALIGVIVSLLFAPIFSGDAFLLFAALNVACFVVLGAAVGYALASVRLKRVRAIKSSSGKVFTEIEWDAD